MKCKITISSFRINLMQEFLIFDKHSKPALTIKNYRHRELFYMKQRCLFENSKSRWWEDI